MLKKSMQNRLLKSILFLLLIILTGCSTFNKDRRQLFAVAKIPTPVLSTYKYNKVFGNKDGKSLILDDDDQIGAVEFVALPDTVFKIKKIINEDNSKIYKVTTEDLTYLFNNDWPVYIDSRFVEVKEIKPEKRKKALPSKETIINRLKSAEGSRYIWGGNHKDGVPELLYMYPPNDFIDPNLRDKWMLKGVDCSGLLYEATEGYTPRNTSRLLRFGNSVEIKGLTVDEIAEKVEPLDIIVWRGHVCIVLNKEQTIQSRIDCDPEIEGNQEGVMIQDLKKVLKGFMKERIAVNDYNDNSIEDKKRFVIRRWYGENKFVDLGKWSEEEFNRLIIESNKIADKEEKIDFLSKQFLGIDYKSPTMIGDIYTPEIFVIYLKGVDDFRYLDYVESMRRSSSYSDFKDNLIKVRYHSDKIDFQTRNHFFTDWIEYNSKWLEDVSEEIGGNKTKSVIKYLNKKDDKAFYFPGIPVVKREIKYIPSDIIDTSITEKLQTGDYIGIYNELPGMDVSHTGIIIKDFNKIYLRHASSSEEVKKVVDSDFKEYISKSEGFIILRTRNIFFSADISSEAVK